MSVIDEIIDRILATARTWAVVGCSPNPNRESHRVAATLQRHGYRIFPIHPVGGEILGEQVYGSVADLPEIPDVVDIFRRSELAGVHVDEAIAVGAKAVWMQLGVVDEAAAERARAGGLDVVMNRCPAIELRRRRR